MTENNWELSRGWADWGMPCAHIIYCGRGENSREIIAEVPSITPYCLGASKADQDYAKEQWDNALLIAAAKMMYTTLKGIAEADPKTWDVGFQSDEQFRLWAQSRARHVLDEAEGKNRK